MNLFKQHYNEDVIENNKIDLIFKIKKGEKIYVEKINIFGNNITKKK